MHIFLRQTMSLGNTVLQLLFMVLISLLPVLNLSYFYIGTFELLLCNGIRTLNQHVKISNELFLLIFMLVYNCVHPLWTLKFHYVLC